MDCDRYREAISARLDGQDTGIRKDALETHLAACSECRAFEIEAADAQRALRVAPADAVPDLSARIMSASRAEAPRSVAPIRYDERTDVLRVTLAVIGLIQLAMSIPALVLGDDAGMSIHMARHLGSFSVALAVALLVVAWRPERASSLLPVLSVLVLCVVATSVLDVWQGRSTPGAEVGHVPELVGLLVVWLLARSRPIAGAFRREVVIG
jgi:predicted anti-sigma-YlaC factor YlaD